MNQNDVDMDIADESPPPTTTTTTTTMSSDQTIKHLLSRQDVSSSLDKAYGEKAENPIWNALPTTTKAELLAFPLMMYSDAEVRNKSYELAGQFLAIVEGMNGMILDGLSRELKHNYDLERFQNRIEELFRWFEGESSKYGAPYFPLVQSSGMGKTKLFTEYRKLVRKQKNRNMLCLAFLCINADLAKQEEEKYFDDTLLFYGNDHFQTIHAKMDEVLDDKLKMLRGEKTSDLGTEGGEETLTTKLVLLFDESQGLMKGDTQGHDCLVFRAIRWWLRATRPNLQVVAVFAGTSAKVLNFYPGDPPPTTSSRCAKTHYVNCAENVPDSATGRYGPFFMLNTIACLRQNPRQNRAESETEFDVAALYGRPLFAHYQLEGKLDDSKLAVFAKRLVLSKKNHERDLTACYSVLGSRLQMGVILSSEAVSSLVSSGYACLASFWAPEFEGGNVSLYSVFMPDPVCAAMAYRYMNPDSRTQETRKFWVMRAKDAFARRLCRPEKGDVGEVFGALYMLLCADLLRHEMPENNTSKWRVEKFSVPLSDWFSLVKLGGKRGTTGDQKDFQSSSVRGTRRPTSKARTAELNTQSTEETVEMTVSVLQCCRTHVRSDSFLSEAYLTYLYDAGLGLYTYLNCEAFDLVVPTRLTFHHKSTQQHTFRYLPCLVSIKNGSKVVASDVTTWVATQKEYLANYRKEVGEAKATKALCITVVLGCGSCAQCNEENMNDGLEAGTGKGFPYDDAFRLIQIPEDDVFGVSEAVTALWQESESSEMYASHPMLIQEEATNAKSFLRSTSKAVEEVSKLVNALTFVDESHQKMAEAVEMPS